MDMIYQSKSSSSYSSSIDSAFVFLNLSIFLVTEPCGREEEVFICSKSICTVSGKDLPAVEFKF